MESKRVSRCVAVDWSGAIERAEKRIWLARVQSGVVEQLECERDRQSVADYLITQARVEPDVIVGLDFAFSLPQWFLDERGLSSAHELWALAASEGEGWLSDCSPPFWGRPGKMRPSLPSHFRRADAEVPPIGGIKPKSVFQIGGAGAVGTGSLRGMPILRQLRDAGFAIWPFDEVGRSTVIEIYPRLLTGAVAKSSASARCEYLESRYPNLESRFRQLGESSEDAFDALVSALVMDENRAAFSNLPVARDDQDRKEGRIWFPMKRQQGEVRREKIASALRLVSDTVVAPTAVHMSATGVRLFEDFRDNLVVDRFDPQLAKMSGAKRNALRSENSEDALTWNAFRALRRADPKLWIPQLSRRTFEGNELEVEGDSELHLWNKVEPPPSLRRVQRDEGAIEIDVIVETDTWVWMIEAKLHSDISLITTNSNSRDQLLRNLDVGTYYAGVRRFYFSFLTLGGEHSPVGNARLEVYRRNLGGIRDALRHRADRLPNLAQIGSLTWMDIRDVLRDVARQSPHEDASVAAVLALTWMDDKISKDE